MRQNGGLRLVAWVLLMAIPATGCGRGSGHATPDEGPMVMVKVIHAGPAAEEALVLPARVTAREEVTLTARLSARLTDLPVREGGRFRRGQTLASFDAPETRAALEGVRAGLAAATLARDLARKQEARMDSLYASRVAALRELEGAQAERRAAEAAWAQARSQEEQMRSAVAIEAPFDGVVVRRHVDPGATVSGGQALLDIRSGDVGEIAAAVPESELGRLAQGPAEYQIGDGPWRDARVARVDGMTDFATRSRVARLRPITAARLEPGAFARVRIGGAKPAAAAPGGARAGFTVPAGAVVRRGGLAGVFVVEDGAARMRWLRVGRESGGVVEVLAGLEAPDAVIADPAGLEDGRRVKVGP